MNFPSCVLSSASRADWAACASLRDSAAYLSAPVLDALAIDWRAASTSAVGGELQPATAKMRNGRTTTNARIGIAASPFRESQSRPTLGRAGTPEVAECKSIAKYTRCANSDELPADG